MNPEDLDELRSLTAEVVDNELIESSGGDSFELKHKSNEYEEKIERQASSMTGASMTPQEMEYLASERKGMSNEELEKFLNRTHEDSRVLGEWHSFSRSEEKFLIQNFQTSGPEEMAERLDRDVKEVKVKLKIIGLNPEEM